MTGEVLAGTSLTLTCVAVIDRIPHLKWIGPNGEPVTSGNGIVVSQQNDSNTFSTVTLTFDDVHTSHAGDYNCSCELQEPDSRVEEQYSLLVISKFVIYLLIFITKHFNIIIIQQPNISSVFSY